jgi:hypothetical protein
MHTYRIFVQETNSWHMVLAVKANSYEDAWRQALQLLKPAQLCKPLHLRQEEQKSREDIANPD